MTSRGATARPASTVGSAFAWARGQLSAAGIESASLDARILLDNAAGEGRGTILAWRDRYLTEEQRGRLEEWIERRARREPVARILGRKEFWSLSFRIGAETLVPRPDSETLVETALGILSDPGAPARLLDLGTGTGCLLLAVLSERPAAVGLGIDISRDAVAVATANASDLGLAGRARFQVGDWGDGLDGPFDLILCNPPYIASADITALDPDVVHHDPRRALDGGSDGLAAIRFVAGTAKRLLAAGGALVMEIGWDQTMTAAACLAATGLTAAPAIHDLGGRPRCLVARHP